RSQHVKSSLETKTLSSLNICFVLLALFFVAPFLLAQFRGDKPADDGARAAPTSATKQEVEQLRQEVAELKAVIQRLLLVNQQGAAAPRLVQVSAVRPETSADPAQAATAAPSKTQETPATELKF